MRKEKSKRKASNNYWINRALKREKEAHLTGNELNKKLFEFYENASNDIRKQINDFYHRYASENGLTFDEAMRELNKSEYKEWKKSLEEYVREYETEADPKRAAELKAVVDARAYQSRITRLEAVSTQIEGAVNGLYFGAVKAMNKDLAEVFKKSFIGKAADLAEHFDIDMGFTKKYFSEKMIEDVISYPWCGNHFSDRLWKNKENLIFNLRDILSKGLKGGTSLPQMAKEMADKTGQSFTAAYNLVESETTHFHEEANFRAYEAAGIEQYQFWSEHELSVCSTCAGLDMQVFDVKDRKEGINAPPMHNHCRCITVEYDPHEKEDYIASGLEPPEDRQTWKQWYDGEVQRRGKDAVERDIKMIKNEYADKKQFERYTEVLGKKNMPESLDAFKELKYNNSEEWNSKKREYATISKIKSKETYSELYRKKLISNYYSFKEYGYEFTDHSLNRFLGQKSGKDKVHFDKDKLLEVLKGEANYTENDRIIKFYDGIAVIQNNNTKEVVSIVTRNKPKGGWQKYEK